MVTESRSGTKGPQQDRDRFCARALKAEASWVETIHFQKGLRIRSETCDMLQSREKAECDGWYAANARLLPKEHWCSDVLGDRLISAGLPRAREPDSRELY